MRLLLVEDDKKVAPFVAKGLKQAGFAVDHVDNGEDGLDWALTSSYDAAIIDLMLPRMDGLTLIDRLRSQGVTTPVLILSAKRSVDDRVKGLQAGGDDYVVKPFAFAELLARIQALLRRASGVAEPTSMTVGDLSIDLLKREARRNGQVLDLQPKELALLEFLMRNAGRVVSKTMILDRVWGYNFDPHTNVVEARISRLRDKIDRDGEKSVIETLRGVGYVFTSPG